MKLYLFFFKSIKSIDFLYLSLNLLSAAFFIKAISLYKKGFLNHDISQNSLIRQCFFWLAQLYHILKVISCLVAGLFLLAVFLSYF